MKSDPKHQPVHKRLASKEKVRVHRDRLRAQGLRPIQIWVPDTRSSTFKAAARRQSQLVARSKRAREDQDFIDAASSPRGD
jgi:hypothetical protein